MSYLDRLSIWRFFIPLHLVAYQMQKLGVRRTEEEGLESYFLQ